MLNYIATYFVSFLVTGPMKDTKGSSSNPQSFQILDSAKLPVIVPGSRLNIGFIIALVVIVLYFIFFWHTSLGYGIRVVGLNENAGKYAGINKNVHQGIAMALSGGIAGLAGAIEILGVQTRLTQAFAGNLGFEGIAAALLGNNSPIGILFSSILFGAMSSGAGTMEMLAKVPNAYISVIQGLIILFIVGRNIPAQKVRELFVKKAPKEE
jgi:simple sugar transport system permease protein